MRHTICWSLRCCRAPPSICDGELQFFTHLVRYIGGGDQRLRRLHHCGCWCPSLPSAPPLLSSPSIGRARSSRMAGVAPSRAQVRGCSRTDRDHGCLRDLLHDAATAPVSWFHTKPTVQIICDQVLCCTGWAPVGITWAWVVIFFVLADTAKALVQVCCCRTRLQHRSSCWSGMFVSPKREFADWPVMGGAEPE